MADFQCVTVRHFIVFREDTLLPHGLGYLHFFGHDRDGTFIIFIIGNEYLSFIVRNIGYKYSIRPADFYLHLTYFFRNADRII